MTRWAVLLCLVVPTAADAQPLARGDRGGRSGGGRPGGFRPLLPVPAVPPAVDRLGDPLPAGAVARFGSGRLRHGDSPGLAFTRDGKRLVSLSVGEGLRLWDPATGREVARLDRAVTEAAVGPDGVVVFAEEDRLRVWTPGPGGGVRNLPDDILPGMVEALDISPDGRQLAAAVNQTIFLLDPATGEAAAALKVPGRNSPTRLLFSPDGRWLAGNGPKTGVWLWDLRTRRRVRTYEVTNEPVTFNFSPDGERLAIAADNLTVYPTDAEEPDPEFAPYTERSAAPRFSRDGATLYALSGDGAVLRFDAVTGEPAKEGWPAPAGEFQGPFVLAPDAALAAATDGNGGIRVWDPRTGKGPEVDRHPPLMYPAFAADGKTASCLDANLGVRHFDPKTGAAGKFHQAGPEADISLAWDPRAGRAVVRGSGETAEVRVVEAAGGAVLFKLALGPNGGASAAFFPADPDRLAVFTDGSVQVVDIPAGRVVRSFAVGKGDESVDGVVSPDGRLVALTTNPLSVWEVGTGKRRLELSAVADPDGVAFSRDGRQLAAWDGGEVAILDVRTGAVVRRFRTPGGNAMTAAGVFSPDGTRLATGGADGLVVVWDLATREPVFGLDRHDSAVCGLAFSPDGKRLLSTAQDGTALVWDVSGVAVAVAEAKVGGADEAVKLLASADPAEAQRGMDFLYRDPAAAAGRLAGRVPVPAPFPADKLAGLVRDLGADEFPTRQAAARGLEEVGPPAAAALRAVAKGGGAEVRKVAERLLLKIDGPATRPDDLRALRAVEVLEWVGTADARALLRKWADGPPGHRQTTEAAAALRRLDPPPAAAKR